MAVTYTDEQRACVESLVGPVDVSAGAGSGKTFTLTQRIAYALESPDSGVDDVEQICAITFTEKAAAELKGRVRSTLRAKGLFDQALKVDGAWISTIHGMCSRILRGQALRLGIDPAFGVIDERGRSALFDQALDEVLREDAEGERRFIELSDALKVDSDGFGLSLKDLVQKLLDASLGLPHGADDLQRCTSGARDSYAYQATLLLEAYEPLHQALLDYKEGVQRNEALEFIDAAKGALQCFLNGADHGLDSFLAALDGCKMIRKFTAKSLKPFCEDYLEVHQSVVRDAVMGRSGRLLEAAIVLAVQVGRRFDSLKHQQAVLDNNDLVVLAAKALDDPEIAALYENKFRLIMVDEFQDTDDLQLRIVSRLSGPGMRYLCTVGDAQQSIYGFRGADIAVYRAYQKKLDDHSLVDGGAHPSKLMLSRNFRSHFDVLAFVKAICQQRRVFGDGFLDLSAIYDGAKYLSCEPRIQIACSIAAPGKGPGTTIADARAVQAHQIAQYFSRMHHAGHKLSDMVLLLGSTTQAALYAQAIRNQVGPCVVAGGSLFAASEEARAVASVLRALVNPQDSQVLFQVLTGPLFQLNAKDLLDLATNKENFCLANQKLDKGFAQALREASAGLSFQSSKMQHALLVLGNSQKALRSAPLSQVLRGVLVDSGWLLRLEAQGAEGLAKAGNVMKAFRLVRQIEQDNASGPVRTVQLFEESLSTLKEAPGALNASGQEAVRIMTIHASKGLEFPIVALADFDKSSRPERIVSRKVEGVPYVSLKMPLESLAGQKDQMKKAFDFELFEDEATVAALEAASPDVFHGLLVQDSQEASAAECQRLFYVGATRAKESLCVFLAFKPDKSGSVCPEEGLAADIRCALFRGEAYPLEDTQVDYGGSRPLEYRVSFASAESPQDGLEATEGQASDQVEPGAFLVPPVKPYVMLPVDVPRRGETGLFSYSSLSCQETNSIADQLPTCEDVELSKCDWEDGFGQESRSLRKSTADDDKATDFGSAFHRLAQIAALRGPDVARDRVDILAKTYEVADRERLSSALDRWLGSSWCQEAFAFDFCQPEVPFALKVDEGVLEGEIDLLCTNKDDLSYALVIDYKTGGHAGEGMEELRAKHQLQAECYAKAVLAQGYSKVDLVFFRVEQGNAVTFSFE